MTPIQYEDPSRFQVSIGVALLAFSVLLPWLFLREPFDLLTSTQTLSGLTETAQSALSERQTVVRTLIAVIPFASVGLFLSGLVVLGFGIAGWRKRQTLLDAKTGLENQKLQLEIQEMSPKEIVAKAASEVERAAKADGGATPDVPPARFDVAQYLAVETAVLSKVTAVLPAYYRIQRNVRVAGREYDAIASSGNPRWRDLLIEVKYARRHLTTPFVHPLSDAVRALLVDYKSMTGRPANAILVVVSPRQVTGEERDRLQSASGTGLQVVILSEDELSQMSLEDFRRALLPEEWTSLAFT